MLKKPPLLSSLDAKKVQCQHKIEDICKFKVLYHGKYCNNIAEKLADWECQEKAR